MTEHKEQPTTGQFELGAVFAALADPLRRSIVEGLLGEPAGARVRCSSFGVGLPRSTMTHHFKVLRESGLITQFDFGNRAEIVLRSEDLDTRFPGLLGLLAAEMSNSGTPTAPATAVG